MVQLSTKLLQAVELIQTGENMNLIDAIGQINQSSDPTPEDVVNDQLEWEQERRELANGNRCDDGFNWTLDYDFNHLFGRPSVTKINGMPAYEWNKNYGGINWKRNRFNRR